jgi:lipoprotein NlpD
MGNTITVKERCIEIKKILMSLLVGVTMFSAVALAEPLVVDTKANSTDKPNNIQDTKVKHWSAPVKEPIIAEFSPSGAIFNPGVNFETKLGEPVKVVADGVVIYADYLGGYGLVVIIEHGEHLSTLYANCCKMKINLGEKVKAGDVICFAGQSGNVFRPLLHFEVRECGIPMNPRNYLKDK